jgi:predicted RNase H-like HicB family nuclease
MTYHVTLQRSPEGNILAACPDLPGCTARGRNEQEAIHNIKESITAWFWDERQHPGGMQLPIAV